MATDYNNRLITPDLEKAMKDYPLYSQDSKKKDALCIAVFYLGNIRWYIMEGQQEGNDFTLYGIVTGLQETEYGYHHRRFGRNGVRLHISQRNGKCGFGRIQVRTRYNHGRAGKGFPTM